MTKQRACLCALILLLLPALLPASDTLLIHGHIYTGNAKAPWGQAIAITGTRIDAVGSDQEILARRQPKTQVIDLQGRTVIPGISDSHTHMWFGAMALRGINLSTPEFSITPDTADTLVEKIKSYAASHPEEKILFGRADFSMTPPSTPLHDLLDRAVPDRPLIIHHTSEHALWVNAKALELAGINDKPVADPAEEKYIIRDASGHPSGVLLEAAMEIVERAVLAAVPREEKFALLREASHFLNRYGVTSVVNATGNLAEIELYATLRDRGQLTVRTRTSFGAVAVNHHLTPEFLADLEKARTLYHDDWVSANLVKFFADGGSGMIPPLTYTPEEYKKLVLELDKRGFQVMTHALRGDSVQMVLDTYEAVEKQNGPRDRRFRLEHADIVAAPDLPRFTKLSVLVSMQPSFCCSDIGANFDPQDKTPTDRWNSLQQSGALLAFGSDWPCTWPPDPFVSIQETVRRQVWRSPNPNNSPGWIFDGAGQAGSVTSMEVYVPEEQITVEQAVNAYTKGSAFARFSEDRLGTLEPGKEADLAVLSQNIFSVAHEEIGKTKVWMTMVGGKIVFQGTN
ncbi:MAG TPA: amidohydrolase [Candidatus Limnocylindrales bacterium]|nr:amidohydrolase [Candidatus Limnocylindrales bacterium]